MGGPLTGVRVLDLTRVLAGPFASMILGDMGAEVVKIENPDGGDDTRAWGPPFHDGESSYFLSVNRNKQSCTLNLKTSQGRDVLRQLASRADVLLENFRPGTLARLGLSYSEAAAANPRVIYCSVSGFGQTGPDAARPGYDLIVQGESGVMSVTGIADGPPLKVGLPIADLVGGLYAVQGILLALYARERTGRGQHVDVALSDGMASLLTFQAGIYFATGRSPQRRGNQHPSIVPYETFRARDGYLNIAVGNNALWARFCDAIGRPDLITHPDFSTEALRVEHHGALKPLLDAVLGRRTVGEWMVLLGERGIPCGAIKDVSEVCADQQIVAREMVVEVPHTKLGTVRMMGIPVKLSATPGAATAGPPLLGEHTEAVLAEWLNLAPEAVAGLRADGII
jgi:crotonobetainyl-CoA:carnitine CoA-transferase CaiB-like acyl-CoA transferase